MLLSLCCLSQTVANFTYNERDLLVRKARWLPLIYPRSHPARFKFIAGFGIPVDDLHIESITTGYVLKAHYRLPMRAQELRNKFMPHEESRQLHSNASIFQQSLLKSDAELGVTTSWLDELTQPWQGYRWAVYGAFESLALRMKLNGRQCVLKSICESAAAPFDERNGLLGELLHIVLTPSTSKDALSEHTDNDYLQAEHLGVAGISCDQLYTHCPKSLLQHFSDVHHLGSEFLKMLG
ncbi:uncharacterized protein LOC108598210 [Drosophila busckii]|nr:uncharacterized protein LOC108598210 [Drosophila busckii]